MSQVQGNATAGEMPATASGEMPIRQVVRSGRWFHVFGDRLIPVIAGGEGETGEGETSDRAGAAGGTNEGTNPGADEANMPENVKAILAKERSAREAAERQVKAVVRERDAHAAKLKDAEDAQLSEVEKTKKEAADAKARADQLETQLKSERTRSALERAAVAETFVDPEDAFLRLASQVEFDEAGTPTNVETLVKQLAKNKPHLVGTATRPAAPGSTSNPKPAGAAIDAANAEYERLRKQPAYSGGF